MHYFAIESDSPMICVWNMCKKKFQGVKEEFATYFAKTVLFADEKVVKFANIKKKKNTWSLREVECG